MRYLGRFASEAQVQFYAPQLQNDPKDEYLMFEKVEEFLLDILQKNEFLPSTYEKLMDCFRKIDVMKIGMIKLEKFKLMVDKSEYGT
jgi:hypothetical protein